MAEPHFGRHITPRWLDYIKDRWMNFALFVDSLMEDRQVIEVRYDIQFKNPLILSPEMDAAHYEEKAWSYWEMDMVDQASDCMDRAAWYGVASLLGVYKTTAAHRIVLARKDLENCSDRNGMDQLVQSHEEARVCYGKARQIDISFDRLPEHESLQAADRMMEQFVLAIEAADQSFYSK